MKTIIMAGGKGSRIASINSDVPKPLIEINHKPVLQYEIESLVSQGLTNIILTVFYRAKMIQDYFGDGSKFGARISYFTEEVPLGNAGALIKMKKELDEDFLLLNADSMFDIDFHRFIEFHNRHHALASLFTHPNSHPYDSGLIIADDEHRVLAWLNKEDERPIFYKNRVNAGLHILSPEILSLTVERGINQNIVGVSRKVDLDRDVLKPAVPLSRIYAYDSSEYVKDMGTPDRFHVVCADVKNGKVRAKNLKNKQKAIFLDRDGTINKYVGFLRSINQFELLEGTVEAIKRINNLGYLAIVITNQPVIARGDITVEELNNIHNKMETLLGKGGAYLDGIYYCPHHPDKGFDGERLELKFDCNCRKPKPGLVFQAAKDFNIDLSSSWFIGDSWRDIATGQNAGVKTALIAGEDLSLLPKEVEPTVRVKSILDFVEQYL